LYESGARIGEVGSMRIRDVSFEESYARLMLKGKTGSRRVIVVAATPYLQTWIQNHPLRNDPDAPLWVNIGTVNRFKAMSYPALAKILKVAAERAGLSKKVHPHKLRHSRATFLASKLTEAQMNQVFGWKQGSDMPSIYVHLSGRDLDDAILGVYGLRKVDEKEPKLKPKICPRCNTSNAIEARFCMKCGLALDVKAAQEIEEARSKTDKIMNLLMKDSEFRELLLRKLRELEYS
jgi:ribosomal protein L40E